MSTTVVVCHLAPVRVGICRLFNSSAILGYLRRIDRDACHAPLALAFNRRRDLGRRSFLALAQAGLFSGRWPSVEMLNLAPFQPVPISRSQAFRRPCYLVVWTAPISTDVPNSWPFSSVPRPSTFWPGPPRTAGLLADGRKVCSCPWS